MLFHFKLAVLVYDISLARSAYENARREQVGCCLYLHVAALGQGGDVVSGQAK